MTLLRTKLTLCRAILAVLILGFFNKPGLTETAAPADVELRMGIKIPMRDGNQLNADLFLPLNGSGSQPVVFVLTPYTTDKYFLDDCIYYARNGYACTIVDVRGRGNSQGKFSPLENDAQDGYDTVEWLAKQSWSNGKVGMFGFSYVGFTQWTTLKEFPPHLATIVPTASAHPGYDFPITQGIASYWTIQWLMATNGVGLASNLVKNEQFWANKLQKLYQGDYSFAQLDELTANLPNPIFQKWIAHPQTDRFWQEMVPTAADYLKISIPILTITGAYDGDQIGALHYYQQHMRQGDAKTINQHYLVIGPWDHFGTHKTEAEFGGLKFEPPSLVDLHLLHKQWFDWTLMNGARPDFLKQRVAYYVAGLEQWKYAEHLEDVGNKSKKFYLSSEGRADDVFHSGSLSEQNSSRAAFDTYTYDPLRFYPYAPEQGQDYAFDCSSKDKEWVNACDAMGIQGNGLIYHTAPLVENTEISGRMKFSAWIAMDVPDTDFWVTVDEVRMDGSIINLTSIKQRARYRQSLSESHLIKTGELLAYEFSTFYFNARRIAKGSRLRLTLATPAPNNERNYNSGKAVAHETAKDAKVAHIRLYHDAKHPSFLEVPLGEMELLQR